jgi:hypothetical protein
MPGVLAGLAGVVMAGFYIGFLRPVSVVPNVAIVSGFSILGCPFGFLGFYFTVISYKFEV